MGEAGHQSILQYKHSALVNYAHGPMHAAAARVANVSESMSEAILGCHFQEKKKKNGDWGS